MPLAPPASAGPAHESVYPFCRGPAEFSVESVRLVETDPTLLDELNETAARCGPFIGR